MRYSDAIGAAGLAGGAGAVATAIEGAGTSSASGVAGATDALGCAIGLGAGSSAAAIVGTVDGRAGVAATGPSGAPATSNAASKTKGANARREPLTGLPFARVRL